jgi:hypothetical protein
MAWIASRSLDEILIFSLLSFFQRVLSIFLVFGYLTFYALDGIPFPSFNGLHEIFFVLVEILLFHEIKNISILNMHNYLFETDATGFLQKLVFLFIPCIKTYPVLPFRSPSM